MNPRIKTLVEATLEKHRKLVWKEIEKYLESPEFPSPFNISAQYKNPERFHWTLAKEYPLRKGKYVRPTLLLLTLAAMGKDIKLGLKLAAAIQLSEEWLLIHDDIEDDSTLRRGKPTLHRLFGLGLAVNAGDTLQTVMWRVLFDNLAILGPEVTEKIITEFYSIIMRTEIGQTVEMQWRSTSKEDFTDKDWYFIADGKTGFYSVAGPLRLGAIIAGATPGELKFLSKFGLELGRCYQLIDDILDVTTDFRDLKERGNDIYEGKRTILLGHLLRTARSQEKKRILSILKKKRREKTKKEIDWVIRMMKTYQSIDYARDLAMKHKNKAQALFDKRLGFLYKEPERSRLRDLVEFILERDY